MYKVGIIGYGKMGQIRHQVISAFEDVQVQSIYDPEIIDTEIEKAQTKYAGRILASGIF
jgi:glyceraldehyde-3-phosphate dehydrogenase/erythrose-4-phosphate dehydrogenase